MPTYEYVCKNCGENFDIHQSFSEKPLKKHKECGGELQKVFHARGIVFKGGGFYATDSKSSDAPEKATSESGSNSMSESKKDSKPKSKADSGSKTGTKAKAKASSTSKDS
jgi:putative FmdB family regulatory protein